MKDEYIRNLNVTEIRDKRSEVVNELAELQAEIKEKEDKSVKLGCFHDNIDGASIGIITQMSGVEIKLNIKDDSPRYLSFTDKQAIFLRSKLEILYPSYRDDEFLKSIKKE